MNKNEQEINIEKYKNSYNSSYFKDVISPNKINGFDNPFYYPPVINSWYDIRLKELIENEYLKDRVNLLTSYLQDLSYLMNCTIELYKSIDRYDVTKREMINRINIKEFDVLSILKLIKKYKISINLNNEKGYIDLSNKIKNYYLFKFDECIEIIEDTFYIKIYDSPINTSFKEVKNIFENEGKNINYSSTNISFKEVRNDSNNDIVNLKSELVGIKNALKIKSENFNLIDDKVEKIIEKFVHLMEDDSLMKKIKNNSNIKDFKKFNWFEVGLSFATGEMDKLKKKFSSNSTQIAKDKFGDKYKGFRPYISESISNTNTSDKNIFSDHDKMLKIIQHCKENNIKVIKDFNNKLPPE